MTQRSCGEEGAPWLPREDPGAQRRSVHEGGAAGSKRRTGPSRGRTGGAPGGVSWEVQEGTHAASLEPRLTPGTSAALLAKPGPGGRAHPWPELSALVAPGGGVDRRGPDIAAWRGLSPAAPSGAVRGRRLLSPPGAEPPLACIPQCPGYGDPHPFRAGTRRGSKRGGTLGPRPVSKLPDTPGLMWVGGVLGVQNSGRLSGQGVYRGGEKLPGDRPSQLLGETRFIFTRHFKKGLLQRRSS